MIVAILSIGLGSHLASLSNYRRLQEQSVLHDRALLAAEAGLASEVAYLEKLPTPPNADVTQTITLPTAQFAPFQNITANIHVQTIGADKYWTVTATADCDMTQTRGAHVVRRVQATFTQQNFAKYELFINDFGPTWTSGYVYFEGLGTVLMGPVNINTGCAFFPDFWSLSEVTSAAPGGVRMFANWGSYIAGVYGKADAGNYVNILQYFSSTYKNAPQFYGGLRTLPAPITLPNDMKVDMRAKQLRDNAGLSLPADYPGYLAAAGPNFAIEQTGGGNITIRQYLGLKPDGKPLYGSDLKTNVAAVNGAIIVKGNIVSLKGTLKGRLTIGAFADAAVPNSGNVNITGDVQYESRTKISGFQYTDAPQVFTADGSGINQAYVDTLQGQLDNVTDILGIVSEGNVTVKQTDLDGVPVANKMDKPIFIDAVIMATGSSTPGGAGGSFGPEAVLTRPPGTAYFLGGIIENRQNDWGLYNSSGLTNGIKMTQLWDKRASQAGGAPPFFPSTGSFEAVPGKWNSVYVKNVSDPIVYPTLP